MMLPATKYSNAARPPDIAEKRYMWGYERFDERLRNLKLSVRGWHALERAGVFSYDEAQKLTYRFLMRVQGCGKHTAREILNVLDIPAYQLLCEQCCVVEGRKAEFFTVDEAEQHLIDYHPHRFLRMWRNVVTRKDAVGFVGGQLYNQANSPSVQTERE